MKRLGDAQRRCVIVGTAVFVGPRDEIGPEHGCLGLQLPRALAVVDLVQEILRDLAEMLVVRHCLLPAAVLLRARSGRGESTERGETHPDRAHLELWCPHLQKVERHGTDHQHQTDASEPARLEPAPAAQPQCFLNRRWSACARGLGLRPHGTSGGERDKDAEHGGEADGDLAQEIALQEQGQVKCDLIAPLQVLIRHNAYADVQKAD